MLNNLFGFFEVVKTCSTHKQLFTLEKKQSSPLLLLQYHLLITTTGNPSDGLSMISGSGRLSSCATEELIEYRRKNHDNTVFSSSIANFWPGECRKIFVERTLGCENFTYAISWSCTEWNISVRVPFLDVFFTESLWIKFGWVLVDLEN
ncbi:hypothetical protein Y032_0130g1553 [Ancylostoma ceylanicum]|uniref:Uncharacterized protein n=1 Tax=Ancylostoma ceylanicum TaxID=53326 RepID=A0A016T7I2_9BILA|nr:hypothetical protein Y032_0130g1553 [Ancylostoma ceylanicum]